jgi:hypothetical protein
MDKGPNGTIENFLPEKATIGRSHMKAHTAPDERRADLDPGGCALPIQA